MFALISRIAAAGMSFLCPGISELGLRSTWLVAMSRMFNSTTHIFHFLAGTVSLLDVTVTLLEGTVVLLKGTVALIEGTAVLLG